MESLYSFRIVFDSADVTFLRDLDFGAKAAADAPHHYHVRRSQEANGAFGLGWREMKQLRILKPLPRIAYVSVWIQTAACMRAWVVHLMACVIAFDVVGRVDSTACLH